MKIKIAATTDIGKVRDNNEDAYIFCPDLTNQEWITEHPTSGSLPTSGGGWRGVYTPLGHFGSLMAVADGMGGTNAGEVASAIAVDTIREVFSNADLNERSSDDDIRQLLQQCVTKADEAINRKTWEDPATAGMGTTIVVCWVRDETAHIAWCGDSRCYIFNPLTGLELLTKDHSYVQELIDRGEISEQEAFSHPDSNIITRGLGDIGSQASPDIVSRPLSPNDVLLLCSDGLTGYCRADDIERTLQDNYLDIGCCNRQLLQLALQAGGHDNICIVQASLIDDDQDAPTPFAHRRSWRDGLRKLLKL